MNAQTVIVTKFRTRNTQSNFVSLITSRIINGLNFSYKKLNGTQLNIVTFLDFIIR